MKECNTITSSSNRFIKDIKLLYNKKDRWNEHCFFIEGTRSVEQCINTMSQIRYIVYSSELLNEDGESLLSRAEKENYKIYKISKELFKMISDTDNPQGILAVVEFKEHSLGDTLKESNFFIVLDRVQDPGNMGTIIRTADAFGANAVIVTSGCVDVYNPKTVRSTMGSILQIPIVHIKDIKQALEELKAENINVIATSLDTDKYSYDIDFKEDCALVIGNEANGILDEVVALSDQRVKIPMAGQAESLNAGVASAVIMYEALRQRNVNL